MKKLVIAACVVLCGAFVSSAASIENVIVRQQWPWSPKVNIDYRLVDADGGSHDVKLTLKDGDKEIPTVYGSITGDQFGVGQGDHRLVWDPQYGGDQGYAKQYPNLTATLSIEDDGKQFMVINVSGGSDAESYPVSFTSTPPSGGWTQGNDYRGSKIVLRRIPAGTFVMGLTQAELDNYKYSREYSRDVFLRRMVTLTKPFYIGVFAVTKQQYKYLEGVAVTPEWEAYGAVKSGVTYKMLRGSATWPALDAESALGRLTAKTQASLASVFPNGRFDLPTQAQWERACRAGTTTTFNNGKDFSVPGSTAYEPNLNGIAIYNDGSYFPNVGTARANAFGLYDMHGLVLEFIRDKLSNASGVSNGVTNPQTDPLLRSSLTDYATAWGCGGRYNAKASECVAGYEMLVGTASSNYNVSDGVGFRLAFVFD